MRFVRASTGKGESNETQLSEAMSQLSVNREPSAPVTGQPDSQPGSRSPTAPGAGESGREASGRHVSVNQRFAANAAWKCYIGEDKKPYHFFRDHVASKSTALKSLMDQQAERGGPNEITFNQATVAGFDIFSHWVYHDCLPSNVINLEQRELRDPTIAVAALMHLYASGLSLGAPGFVNRVMDLIVDIQRKHGKENPIRVTQILKCFRAGLVGTSIYEFFIQRFVLYQVHNDKKNKEDLKWNWFEKTLPFDPKEARIHYDIVRNFANYHAQPEVFLKTSLQADMYHMHKDQDVCYDSACNEYWRRQRERSAKRKTAPISGSISGGPGAPPGLDEG